MNKNKFVCYFLYETQPYKNNYRQVGYYGSLYENDKVIVGYDKYKVPYEVEYPDGIKVCAYDYKRKETITIENKNAFLSMLKETNGTIIKKI